VAYGWLSWFSIDAINVENQPSAWRLSQNGGRVADGCGKHKFRNFKTHLFKVARIWKLDCVAIGFSKGSAVYVA
jgi:hypothetical protein